MDLFYFLNLHVIVFYDVTCFKYRFKCPLGLVVKAFVKVLGRKESCQSWLQPCP